MLKRGYHQEKFSQTVKLLAENKGMPEEHKDHPLRGEWKGFRECHIEFDWLLIYRIEENELTLVLTRTGTHNDLFDR